MALIPSYIYTAVLHGHTCTRTHPWVIASGFPGPITAANTTAANTHPHHTISHPTVHRSTTLCQWVHSSKKEVIPNIMFLTLSYLPLAHPHYPLPAHPIPGGLGMRLVTFSTNDIHTGIHVIYVQYLLHPARLKRLDLAWYINGSAMEISHRLPVWI